MIVASIAEPAPDRVLARMDEAKRAGADVAEVRADFLERPELGEILARKTLPAIVTARASWEGGRWRGNEDDRIALLRTAALGGADYVDVEFKAYKDFERGKAALIVSYHDFEKTPEKLESIAQKMAALDPAAIKIACLARGAADLARLVELQKNLPRPGAVVAMGEAGEALRVMYARYGGMMTYASIGEATAPGQLPVGELVQAYRVKSVDDGTKVYAVVGDPVAHSRGPRVFNRVFHELGINARYVRVRLDDGALFRDVAAALELSGASVTVPHKEAVAARLDEADEAAKAIGAVNTVTVLEGRFIGTNTDAPAAAEAIREAAKRKWSHGVYGMRALVLGAGGAARAIAWALRAEGARVIVANRTFDRAKALAEELRGEYVAWDRLIEARAQVVVNATSVGLGTDESPFPRELWKKDAVALDCVYVPRATRFLREAREAGAETADGVEMYLRQANLQLQQWIGRGMPTELLKEFRATL